MLRAVRRSPAFIGLQALMVLLCFGLYAVTLNIIPMLMEKGADYTTAALGFGLVGAGEVGGGLLFAAIPATARISVITGTATGAILVLALLPGPAPMLIAAGMLAGAVRGCHTLLQATVVADRWGPASLGTLQGSFAAPITSSAALAPAAGTAIATWFGSYTSLAYAMASVTGTAALIAATRLSRGLQSRTKVTGRTNRARSPEEVPIAPDRHRREVRRCWNRI
ncbi:hypothetical protein [Arthrobacter sp. UYCu712]|uniref:hypothetical protein n=1 Tax=Arthrobacter sp. UYCu712 TaxID=3156340 RepID=UPI0033971FE2